MLEVLVSDAWATSFPGAAIGILELSGLDNSRPCPRLEERKPEVEARLRHLYQGFARQDLVSLPVMASYARYYRQFRKTYHVQLQVESIVFKGKHLPAISPLVDSNFLSEVETFVLTAGHDAARLDGPIRIDVSRDGEAITQMNGACKTMHAGDMVMRDAGGVSCSIIYGQDNRSPISSRTTHALYVSYVPVGVSLEAVDGHLQKLEAYLRLCCPDAVTEQRRLISV